MHDILLLTSFGKKKCKLIMRKYEVIPIHGPSEDQLQLLGPFVVLKADFSGV